jgi:hypothetical protein
MQMLASSVITTFGGENFLSGGHFSDSSIFC